MVKYKCTECGVGTYEKDMAERHTRMSGHKVEEQQEPDGLKFITDQEIQANWEAGLPIA